MTRPWPEGKRATARRLRRTEGLSVRAIAERLGIGCSTAGDYVRGLEAERACAYCGGLFWADHARQRYCCESHRGAAKWLRVKADPERYEWELQRRKRLRKSLSPEQRQRRNARRREAWWALTPEQREQYNARRREASRRQWANRSPEQRARRNQWQQEWRRERQAA